MTPKHSSLQILLQISLIIHANSYLFNESKFLVHMIRYMLKDTGKTKVNLVSSASDSMSYSCAVMVHEVMARFDTTSLELGEPGGAERIRDAVARPECLDVVFLDACADDALIESQLQSLLGFFQLYNEREPYPRCLVFVLGHVFDEAVAKMLQRMRTINFLHESTIELVHLKVDAQQPEIPKSFEWPSFDMYNDTDEEDMFSRLDEPYDY